MPTAFGNDSHIIGIAGAVGFLVTNQLNDMINANASAEFLYLIQQWIKRYHPDATLQMGVFKFDIENPHGIIYLIENNEQTKIDTDFDTLSEWHSYESDLGKDMDF